MNTWVSYRNGNYNVYINTAHGTKIRKNDLDFFDASTVESMDIKVTNQCDMGCIMCHENSLPNGKHAHVMENGRCVIDFLNNLHPYCELAIGGGNPLCWPELDDFLKFCKEKKFIPSMTVNQVHFMANLDRLRQLRNNGLIYGLGISLVNLAENGFVEAVKEFPNAVIHVINGMVTPLDLRTLKDNDLKILILGYKEVRRGKDLYMATSPIIELNKANLANILPTIINEKWFRVVSFDNLSLKQLNVKALLTDQQWTEFYMGDDGMDGQQTSATFFVDLVEREFAKNSCSMERFDLTSTAEEMYKALKENKNV